MAKVFVLLITLLASAWIYANCENHLASKKGTNMEATLRVGCPTYWGNLIPALQHTAYADALLSNQFETLVREGRGGTILPGLAKSWTVSEDLTSFTFAPDTSRKFSDGTSLSAQNVKEAWEHGLSLTPQSANSSLQDVLYLVEGYEEFARTKSLRGVKILDEATVQVRFKKPFRTALSEFSTGRMAIFKNIGNVQIGTGPYIIESTSESKLFLHRNPHFDDQVGYSTIEVTIVDPKVAMQAIESGEIDVYAFADRANIPACGTGKVTSISCFSGMESGHLMLTLNGLANRFFSNREHRLAFQYLIHKHVKRENLPSNYQQNLILDPQPYLPLQAGRLNETLVRELVTKGEPYVPAFVKATQKNPLYLVTSEMNNWVQDLMEKLGVKFTTNSGWMETKDRMHMFYKTYEPDILVGGSSIASGDPDGLFHSVAKDGAIHSPMLYRKEISDLLDEGRSILNLNDLDAHYQKVTIKFLEQVPYVHVGFVRGMHAYNKNRVRLVDSVKERETNQFTVFSPL